MDMEYGLMVRWYAFTRTIMPIFSGGAYGDDLILMLRRSTLLGLAQTLAPPLFYEFRDWGKVVSQAQH